MTVMETLKLGPEATLSCFMLFDFHVCCSLTCVIVFKALWELFLLAEITEEDMECHQLRGRSQSRYCLSRSSAEVVREA